MVSSVNLKEGIILSINPEHIKKLRTGEKIFEYRRKLGKKIIKGSIDLIAVYETAPTSRIVGTMKIYNIHRLPIMELWCWTGSKSGLTLDKYLEYFHGLISGYAIEIREYHEVTMPIHLSEIGVDRPPQSYQYLDAEQIEYILRWL